MVKEPPATAFNTYLEPGEQIRYVAYGQKQPNLKIFLVLIVFLVAPGYLYLIAFTKHYLVALTDRRFIALRFRNFWGLTPSDTRVARGHLNVSEVIEYQLTSLPPATTRDGLLFFEIVLLDSAKPFTVKFSRFLYGGKNHTNAQEIAAVLNNKPSSAEEPARSKLGAIACFLSSIVLWAGAAWMLLAFDPGDNRLLQYLDGFILLFAAGMGFQLIQVGRRLLARSAQRVLTDDKRPPIVYLRPFAEDDRLTYSLPVGKRFGGKTIVNPSWRASHEQWLAHALKLVGPVVAVGKPGDQLAPLGAARFYFTDDQWQQKVDALLREAAVVVLRPETSAGTRWEVGEVSQLIDHRRVLLIVPNPSRRPMGFARVKSLMGKTWALPSDSIDADAFIFDEKGNPQPLKLSGSAAAALGPFVDQVEKLQGSATPERNQRKSLWSSELAALENVAHGEPETESAPQGEPSGEFPHVPFRLENGVLSAGTSAEPLANLAWAYGEIVVPASSPFRHYQIVLWNRDAVALVLPVHANYCQTALDTLRRAAPWLPVGFSVALKESWNADHADFLALVDQHRASGTAFEPTWVGPIVVVHPEPSEMDSW